MQSLSQLEPTSVIGRLKIITILKDISTVSSTSRISQLYLQLQESLNCIFNFKNLSTVSSASLPRYRTTVAQTRFFASSGPSLWNRPLLLFVPLFFLFLYLRLYFALS